MKIENKIIYSHLDLLTKDEQITATGIFEAKFPKLQKAIKNDVNLIVDLKIIEKQGPKKQYFFKLRTEAPAREFAITTRESDLERLGEWDLAKAATNSINHLIKIVEHRFSKKDKIEFMKNIKK